MNRLHLLLKKAALISMFTCTGIFAFAQTATAPATGDGTTGNPYQIANLDNLYWLSQTSAEWGKHYIQTADIDAAASSSWDSNQGFTPIGNETTQFSGTYNGKGHSISNLFINRPTINYIGLFGYTLGTNVRIDSLGIIDADLSGNWYVGALIGYIEEGAISNCFSAVTSNSTDTVRAKDGVGGLICKNSFANISNCYSTAICKSNNTGGGFVSFSRYGTIENCYSSGKLIASGTSGGFVRNVTDNPINNCFWDTESTGQATSVGGTGYITSGMKKDTTYTKHTWDFACETTNGANDIWGINPKFNNGYPFLTWQWEGPIPVQETLADITGSGTITVSTSPKAIGLKNDTITATTSSPLSYASAGTFTITWEYTDCKGKKTTQTQKVINSQGTGIEDLANVNIFFYPNPVDKTLYFKAEYKQIQSITITDLSGRVHLKQTNIQNNSVDVSSLNRGMYIMTFDTREGMYSSKLIKE